MFAPRLPRLGTLAAWRDAARALAGAGIEPAAVDWGLEGGAPAMFADPLPPPSAGVTAPKLLADMLPHLVPERTGRGMDVAYRLLMRSQLVRGLMSNRADADVATAFAIAKALRRDIHKMHAFVRFRDVTPGGHDGRRAFAAWFEPDHRIEEVTGPFFASRFGDMDWAITTPEVRIVFAGGTLSYVAGAFVRPDDGDPLEELWTTYYRSIFNPARLKPDAMRAEMPRKYWRNLPEAQAIPDMIATARHRVTAMQATAPRPPAQAVPAGRNVEMKDAFQNDLFGATDLGTLEREAEACTRCPLHGPATQVVFGEGPSGAEVMFVGEQPGDQEDLQGRPFVGPAGQLFDQIMSEAGLDRSEHYVTNAVKHFKFNLRGRRRIHQKPATSEVKACRWWLEQELAQVDPKLCVAMGATALGTLTGNAAGLLKRRGSFERTKDDRPVLVTVHPSYLLRLPDPELKQAETDKFRKDLEKIPEFLSN
ncbi:UdgX family uracil-DNA binding protein [Jannaschia sp. LMIT008]|uniref:UdgX family uracil-DNA binding protein n=1 Tax=Jannaschia maritima TaxID=3032585 RepID=UPI002811BBCB|nr:UdgX family uracil-DNA binding protein [Jannaschia sp. LMIT008]